MKTHCAVAGVTWLACSLAAFAQSDVICGQPLDVPLQSRAAVAIDSRPAGLEVVGTDREGMHVSCTADDSDVARQVHLRFLGTSAGGKLTITGSHGGRGNVRVRIEVPRKLSLGVTMPAGEVKMEEVEGNKDIDLYAGQISISSNQLWNYRSVDASVVVGSVNAPAYGANMGGFFRSLKRNAADGEYQLHAHVVAGEIDLSGRGPQKTTD